MKKDIWSSFNLHKLPEERRETSADKLIKRVQGQAFRQKFLFPMLLELPENRTGGTFIHERVLCHDRGAVSGNDTSLIRKGNLGVGDERGWKKGMSVTADAAEHPADTQGDLNALQLNRAAVIAMERKTGGMAAGTSQLMELETSDDIIIDLLRNTVANIDKNGYHSYKRVGRIQNPVKKD